MDLTETLEKDLARIIGFIGNCDSKTSIILGATLTAVSLILGLCGNEIAKDITGSEIGITITISAVLLGSVAIVIMGITNILNSIRARLNPSEYKDDSSVIFYGKIAPLTLEQYREKVLTRDESSYITDLTAQIHTCSIICQTKFGYYNKGLKYSVIGTGLLIVTAVLSLLV